ncbi:unnamed protein product [Prorocentrum cordatum]|uniref:RNA-directed RNA polymerase n=1 Tax=Prorocentrum cordatum TaxID=2364126 RepID=A0ABN9VYI9_9DINO|nr:unnamed protein product [Polarella glacialis]
MAAASADAGGPMKIDPGKQMVHKGGPTEPKYTLAPLADVLKVDRVGNHSYVVTNMITGETSLVEPFLECELVTVGCDCALALVTMDGDADVKDLDALFKYAVYVDESGHYNISTSRTTKHAPNEFVNWHYLRMKFRRGRSLIPLSYVGAPVDIATCTMKRPREGNQQIWWQLSAVHSILKVASFRKVFSQWFQRLHQSWTTDFVRYIGPSGKGLIIQASYGTDDASNRKSKLLPDMRCLPFACASTAGLLIMLRRIGTTMPKGGENTVITQKCANTLAESLAGLTKRQPWNIALELDDEWVCTWPRPRVKPDGVSAIQITCIGGLADLSQLLAAGERDGPARRWWAVLKYIITGESAQINVGELLKAACGKTALRSLYGQVVLAMSWEIERVCLKQSHGDAPNGPDGFDFKYPKPSDIIDAEGFDSFLCQYTVDQSFDGEGAAPDAVGVNPKKRQADTPTWARRNSEQIGWLTKYTGGERETFKPRKLHRVAAKHWLDNTDNQLRWATAASGWSSFLPVEGGDWSDWRTTPHLTVAIDLGGDGLSAMNLLEYGPKEFKCCVDKFCDPAHGGNRSVVCMLHDVKLWGFMLRKRYKELREAMADFVNSKGAKSSPLFLSKASGLRKCYERQGHKFDDSRDTEDQLLELLSARAGHVPTGMRTNLNRFQGVTACALKNVPNWEVYEFERTYLALHNGWLTTKALLNKFRVKPGPAQIVEEHGGTTTEKIITLETRSALKGATVNCVALSVVLLSDPVSHRICSGFAGLGKHVKDWHTEGNKIGRSAKGTFDWIVRQAGGEFLTRVAGLVATGQDARFLQECDFACSEADAQKLDANDVAMEDEAAMMITDMQWCLVKHRLSRGLHMTLGWPWRMVGIHSDEPGLADQILQKFKVDMEAYEALAKYLPMSAAVKEVVDRRLFGKISNQVLQRACLDPAVNFSPHAELKSLLQRWASGLLMTQIVEDINGAQKNNRQVMSAARFRKPEKSMAVALGSGILEERRDFDLLMPEHVYVAKSARLPAEAFRPSPATRSLKFERLVSTTPSVPWHSPSAINVHANMADLVCLRTIHGSDKNFGRMENAWHGQLVSWKHHFVFRFSGTDQ